MKITLKKLGIYERMSEETTAFTADIYADGKKIGYAKNDGHGGCTNCQPYLETMDHFKKVSKQVNLEDIVDGLVDDEVNNREQKRFEKIRNKAMLTGFVVGVKGGESFRTFKLRGGQTIAALSKEAINRNIASIEDHLKEGEEILNTNI